MNIFKSKIFPQSELGQFALLYFGGLMTVTACIGIGVTLASAAAESISS